MQISLNRPPGHPHAWAGRCFIGLMAGLMVLAGCTTPLVEPTSGRWLKLDAGTQRWSIDAAQVSRGELLDELTRLSGAEVRPQVAREESLTLQQAYLDLEDLVGLLLPPGSRPVLRWGEKERKGAPPMAPVAKAGPALKPSDGAVSKPAPDAKAGPRIPLDGRVKADFDAPLKAVVDGPGTKAPAAASMRVSESAGPKHPLRQTVEKATVRVVLLFEEGQAPTVMDVQAIEGRAPQQRYVTGSWLYVLRASDGSLLEAGTFQDPLVQRSYQPQGPHAVQRARSGAVGISLARELLPKGTLVLLDMTGTALPRELTPEVVRMALSRGRVALELETQTLTRRLESEKR